MAVCASSGHSKLFLRAARCVNCDRRGCHRCLRTFGWAQKAQGGETVEQRVCSDGCFDAWVTNILEEGFAPTASGPRWSVRETILHDAFLPRAFEVAERHRVTMAVRYAQNLLEAERTEDAAKVYESLGMWKEAGEIRRKAKRSVVIQVQVDANDLIEQARHGGLSIAYARPACQNPFEIDANTDIRELNRCRHCGTAIRMTDLVELLAGLVGNR